MIWWFRYWLRFHANSFCVHTARISNSLPTHYLLLSYNLNHFNINIKSIFLLYYLLHFPVPSFTVLYCKVDPFCRFAVFKIFALYHVIMNPHILQNFLKNLTPFVNNLSPWKFIARIKLLNCLSRSFSKRNVCNSEDPENVPIPKLGF